MEKKFYKYALYAVLASACLSVLGSIILWIAYRHDQAGTTLYSFLNYLKVAFDLIALFVGLGTIVFGFARFGLRGGLKSMLIFCSSYGIAVAWFVIGLLIETGFISMADIMANISYSIGSNFMSFLLPGILVGLISHYNTEKDARDPETFIGLTNPTHRAMVFSTLAVFGLNFVYIYAISVFPFLIEEKFYIFFSDFLSIIVYPTVESILEYLVIQYVFYMLVYNFYKKLLSNVPQRHQHNK